MPIEKVVIGDATLYRADCLEVLPTLPKVDAVITDPPYGVDKAQWDALFPLPAVWRAVAGVVADGGSLLVFAGEQDAPAKLVALQVGGLEYQWVLVWYASNAMQFGKTGFTKKSLIWWLSKGKPLARPKMPDLYEVAIIPAENDFGHPSPKPLKTIVPLVDGFSARDQTVLDPFMGSATTGVACMDLGRKFIGIEIERRYFDIACQRIENAYRQGKLFDDIACERIENAQRQGRLIA